MNLTPEARADLFVKREPERFFERARERGRAVRRLLLAISMAGGRLREDEVRPHWVATEAIRRGHAARDVDGVLTLTERGRELAES